MGIYNGIEGKKSKQNQNEQNIPMNENEEDEKKYISILIIFYVVAFKCFVMFSLLST